MKCGFLCLLLLSIYERMLAGYFLKYLLHYRSSCHLLPAGRTGSSMRARRRTC
ncbi:hypothetical protein PR003_g23047 [Phytophthora rubi]|uniref:Uncharacterized protein n=1 Tax=Phytophthora rubi TaxID=129364 RepID=A0A6A4DAM7_9STRA|nr:hypothetical protein PR002_g22508 [Phytophthora rubi]KAE8991795.1 hypothetical protein PR001_g21128 [Phytophthora rubi]KAE9299269.1 hypothetical protein PR003_g23047 [Phytophthora rubi]